jgi:hypothetical protein
MSVITTGSIAKALWPGVNKFWGEYSEYPLECTALFDQETSDRAYEEDVLVPGFGLAPAKTQGAAVQYDTHQQGYISRYTHITYALGYILTYEEIQDNQYPELAKSRTRRLAFALRQTKETVAANVYNRATNASYTGGDGVALLSASHPSQAGLLSNILSPAADLSESSLEDLLIQIMTSTDDRGLKVQIMGKKLIVPPALLFEASRILKSTLQNDTANNAVNAIRAEGMLPEGVAVNHYLTDTDAWFVRTDTPEGLKMFTRMPLEFSEDNDFDTMNLKYKAMERYSVGWTDFRGLYGSPGA